MYIPVTDHYLPIWQSHSFGSAKTSIVNVTALTVPSTRLLS